jgi:hypothetical protein
MASNGPLVLRWFKRLVDQTLPQGPGEKSSRARADIRQVLDSKDSYEALDALLAQRSPVYRGH